MLTKLPFSHEFASEINQTIFILGLKMSHPFNLDQLNKIKTFMELCIKNPRILNLPDLAFIKDFIKHFGGTIPESKSEAKAEEFKSNEPKMEAEPDSEESDIELDMTGVIGNFYIFIWKKIIYFYNFF